MGTGNIAAATDGTIIPANDHNSLRDALLIDFLCRNSSGVPTDLAGALGESTKRWADAFLQQLHIGAATSNIRLRESSTDVVELDFNGTIGFRVSKADGVDGALLKKASVTKAKDQAVVPNSATSSGSWSTTSGTFQHVASNQTVSITASRDLASPYLLLTGSSTNCYVGTSAGGEAEFQMTRDTGGGDVAFWNFSLKDVEKISPAIVHKIDFNQINESDGAVTYKLWARAVSGTVYVENCFLRVHEV